MKMIFKISMIVLLSIASHTVFALDKTSVNGVSLSGWHVTGNPKVANSTMDTGKIVYAVEIDSLGAIINLRIIENTISETLAQKCEMEIRKMNFVKKANNTTTAPSSKGTITFIFNVN